MHSFTGRNADQAWRKAAKAVSNKRLAHEISSRSGQTNEMLHVGFTIEEPMQRWVFCRRPPVNIAFAFAEVVWIINGQTDSKSLTYWNRNLPKFVGKGNHLYAAYGYRLREHFDFDQLRRAYAILQKMKDSRRAVLQIWDANRDLRTSNVWKSPNIPCNIVSLLRVHAGKLNWLQVLRSNDLFRGTPYNFIQFTYLQEILAGWLALKVGTYTHVVNSLHVYDDDLQYFKNLKYQRPILHSDTVQLPFTESAKYWRELARRLSLLVSESLTERNHYRLSVWEEAPEGFQNILKICASEGARRRKWKELVNSIANECTNPALNKLWAAWLTRVSRN